MSQPVVCDVNVLATAVARGQRGFWASTNLPLTGNFSGNCVGIVSDAQELGLWLSEHVVANTLRVLVYLGWDQDRAEGYVRNLTRIARKSGGGIAEPVVAVSDCDDYEDNRILELALASGSVLIVSDDEDPLRLSPWRGTPILRPVELAGRVDAMRRACRRQ